MEFCRTTIKIVCVDESADEDLMFDRSCVRALERVPRSVSVILVVGSGEQIERGMHLHGVAATREKGRLDLADSRVSAVYERLMREKGRTLVQLFTDAGISSVGFFGADRGMIKVDGAGSPIASGAETLAGLSRSGVLSVLVSAGKDTMGHLRDVNPAANCAAISATLVDTYPDIMCEIVLLASRIPSELEGRFDANATHTLPELIEKGVVLAPNTEYEAKKMTQKYFISTIAKLADFKAIAVKN